MRGTIHSIDTFSTLDGPGIRTVIFLQGCALRCQYCQNPDTWSLTSKAAEFYTVDEIMKVVRRGQPYFQASGGGITLSGGEPLLQAEFMTAVFSACRREHIPTAFDSSLYVPSSSVKKVLPVTDLVLADIKQMHPEKSRSLTGSPHQGLNFDNLRLINAYPVPVWIRYVVIPGYTDDPDDVSALAGFVARLSSVERIDLLPYHALGVHKWELLGKKYELEEVEPPTAEELTRLAGQIESLSGKPVFWQ